MNKISLKDIPEAPAGADSDDPAADSDAQAENGDLGDDLADGEA